MLTAKVRVMRSYDYNHFEVEIGSDECKTLDDIDNLRKQAAVLVDDAIRQYKIAKKKESARESKEWQYEHALLRIEGIKSRPNGEWTVEDAALMRSFEDKSFWADVDKEGYWYDDPERDHHFSMLTRFKDSKVKV